MSIATGTRLGRYEIRSLLGRGGMGKVSPAHDTQLARTVALKVLTAAVASDAERMRRFTREAKSAAALNRPLITHIYEIGGSGGTHFIAMVDVESVTLREKIIGRKPRSRCCSATCSRRPKVWPKLTPQALSTGI